MLALSRGDRVLDIACGPGNFTRDFAPAAADGLVVGIDASGTMLARAVEKTASANMSYVRGDACALPFRAGSFDDVCCFAALYLIEQPTRALDEIARVLAPGGRVALLSSCNRGPLPARATSAVVHMLSGVRIFARDELTQALADRGLAGVGQRVSDLAQFVSGSGRKSAGQRAARGPAPALDAGPVSGHSPRPADRRGHGSQRPRGDTTEPVRIP